MQIVWPAAGNGSRMSGYNKPKPLIDIMGKPMIQWAVESLDIDAKHTFITRQYDNKEWNEELDEILSKITDKPNIIRINFLTQGAACTVLMSEAVINRKEDLIVSDCDRIFNSRWDPKAYITYAQKCHFCPITYWDNTPANSYVKTDKNNRIIDVAEKQVISENSCVGVHYWATAELCYSSIRTMIRNNFRVNNEFYLTPSLKDLIDRGYEGRPFGIDNGVHNPVGKPEDLQKYLDKYHSGL